MKTYKRDEPNSKIIIIGVVFLLFLIIILTNTIRIVPAGHIGVYDLFGNVRDKELQTGLHFKNPFANIIRMSIKTQEYTMVGTDAIPALTKEGLTVSMEMTLLYKIEPEKASDIYKTVGTNYVGIIVRPQIRTVIREITARYEAKDIYTKDRTVVAQEMFDMLDPELKSRGIILEKVLIRNVRIPQKLTEAIEAKLTAEQDIEKKRFDVGKERAEADRKRVEAKGIADANEIIAESLTKSYLTWYWIENLVSHNSVIYVPIGQDGMPMFKTIQ